MEIVLYTIGCPKCRVLEKMLDKHNIVFHKETNTQVILAKGIDMVPVLEIDGQCLNYDEAIAWVNNLT